MSDEDPTSAGTPSHDSRRVPAYRPPDPADAPPDGTRVMEAAPPDTTPRGERPPSSVMVEGAPPPAARTSTEMAERSRKDRRRERDARAERTAKRVLIGGFLGLGGLAIALVNSGMFDEPAGGGPKPVASASPSPVASPKTRPLTAAPDETPDLPALSALKSSGLTIAAEGLPEVISIDPPNPPPLLAGIETCRFAYAVWELSPNRAFRFLTTCPAFQGQVLVGAYEIRGSRLVMSPLLADGAELLMVFEVEKPSRMTTAVTHASKGARVVMEVRQNITAIRPGMEGDGFYRTFQPKNTVEIAGVAKSHTPRGQEPPTAPQRAPDPAPEAAPKPERDPVLDLLQGGGE